MLGYFEGIFGYCIEVYTTYIRLRCGNPHV